MINVIVSKKLGNIVSFTLDGHADYASADEDRDMVCSAVSAISLTIANGILEILKIDANCNIKDGFLNLNIEDKSKQDIEKCQVLLQTMLLGLRNIEINFGDYIKVKEEEV